MPAREHPINSISTDSPPADAVTAISLADTDEVAQAEAHAQAARARALRLRQQAEAASGDAGDPAAVGVPDVVGERERESKSASSRRWRPRRPGRKALVVTGAVVLVCASLAASGLIVWHHRHVVQERQRAAEFAAVARNAVVLMMSIDADKARDEVQRFADETTGPFKIGILMGGEDLVKAVEQSKASSKGTVKAVAVESMTRDSAIVLVSAKSEVTKPDQAKPDELSSRIIVTVERDAGQLKVSRVEFVP